MGKIHVGRTLLSNRGLEDALRQARVGDELHIHEGTYRAEAIMLNGIHLVGVGEPDQIVLEARLDVWGHTRITGITLRAPHFSNAVYLRSEDAYLDLTGASVGGDPARKYPTVYGDGGTLVLSRTTMSAPEGSLGVALTQSGYLHATDSRVDGIQLIGGRAVLADVSTTTLEGAQGARIEAYNTLTVRPPEGHHAMALSGESVGTISALHLTDPPVSALCEDSFLQIDSVHGDDGGIRVAVRGSSVVESEDDAVTTYDPDAPPPPKVVTWHVSDAHDYLTAVAPHLGAGDTLCLEEGEYFLQDCENGALGIACHVVGAGADRTVLHGSLFLLDGHDASVSDLTVAPREHNGVVNKVDSTLELTDVRITSTSEAYPAVYLGSGTTTMHGCTVAVPADSGAGVTHVTDRARLDATCSDLGWVTAVERGSVSLRDCGSHWLCASGATITSRGSHVVEGNTRSMRQVVAEQSATISLESLATDFPAFEAYAEDSTLSIERLTVPEDGNGQVLVAGGARVRVDESAAITITDLDAQVQARPTAGTGATAPGEGDVPEDHPLEDPREDTPGGVDDPGDDATDEDPLAQIEALTGLTTVKQQVRKFTRMVRYNQLREEQGKAGSPMVLHSLFLGNPGTGKTTVARLLGRALHRAGAIPSDTFVEVTGRADLVGDTIGSSAKLTTAVLESALGGVLFVDEAYTLYKPQANEFAQEAVDTILTFMENHRDEIVVLFAGYGEQMQDFIGMNPGLRSRVTNRFDFEDYTPEEIAEIGYRALLDGQHTVDEDLYRATVAREYTRATDRSNGRWVRNFNQDLVAVLAERVLSSPAETDISHVTAEDLHTLTGGSSRDKDARVRELLDELDAMVGLAPVKEWVRRLVNQVAVDQRRMQLDKGTSRPTYHMVFAGNPGTGKTTVARIVAELFHNLGILATPTVSEVGAVDLIGQYIGHTEANTTRAIDAALGGVLFVDEAYTLTPQDRRNDFGYKAVETLLPRLENDRDKFVAIFAGYSEEMRHFLKANPGLPSRIPGWVEFPDYSSEEVARIVAARLSASWVFDEDHLLEVAASAYDAASGRDNGRWARNFAEKVEGAQVEYIASHDVTDEELDRIPPEVIAALAP